MTPEEWKAYEAEQWERARRERGLRYRTDEDLPPGIHARVEQVIRRIGSMVRSLDGSDRWI